MSKISTEKTTYGSTDRLTMFAEATPAMATTAVVVNFMFEFEA
jgi:hypothetical protein